MSDLLFFPLFRDPVSYRGEEYLHDKLGDSSGQRAGSALEHSPAKSVPEYWSEEYENYDREDEIIQKLTDKGRNVASHCVCELSVGIFAKAFSNSVIEYIIDNIGRLFVYYIQM